MAFKLNVPFFAVKLHLTSGGTVVRPLLDQQKIGMNSGTDALAREFRATFQKAVLNEGNYLSLMDQFTEGDYYKETLQIPFAAARDGVSHPAFDLLLEFYYRSLNDGFWATIPVFGLEVYADEEAQLVNRLEEAIRLHILKKRERSLVKNAVSILWFREVELIRRDITFSISSLRELEDLTEDNNERIIQRVATRLQQGPPIVYGRKKELGQLIKALQSSFSKNILLVGPTGVGKTALVWELARHLKQHRIKHSIWETTASVMIKELSGDSGWQHHLALLCKELFQHQDILFVRNLLELFEVGKYAGNEVSMADYLRSFLSRGEISMISECSEDELARIELKSPNYTNYFQVIRIVEPKEDLENIIIWKVNELAKNRKLRFDPDAVKETIRLNRRYTPYAGYPGKPIRFLESLLINRRKDAPVVTRAEVIRSFCEETGLPPFMVDPEIPMKLNKVEALFNQNVYGQEKAAASLTGLLASVKTALMRTGKPIASLLFIGPTGVGKTEMAKVLATFMFGHRDRMIRFDMSEFSDPYAVMRLTGESYFSDGLLTAAVRRTPFAVLLFDEIEKAHPDFYDLLLQILSEGRLTDSSGKLVNFCSTIIIMTSNIGAGKLPTSRIQLGDQQADDMGAHFLSAVQKHFRPELYNRIDQVIPFEPLGKNVVTHVVKREIDLLLQREGILFRKMELVLDEQLPTFLAARGYDPSYGARFLQRAIRNLLVLPLAEKLSTYDYDDQLIVKVQVKEDQIDIEVDADPLGLDLLLEELDKITLADQASNFRRKISALREHHYYVMMLSQLDIMERKRNKSEEKFWKNKKQSQRYNFYHTAIQKVNDMATAIAKHEEALSLSVLGLQDYNPSIESALDDWKEQLIELKIYLYSNLVPEKNEVLLGIYGPPALATAQLYSEVAQQQNYEILARSVWFRESVYNKEVTDENNPKQKKRAANYIYQDWKPEAEAPMEGTKKEDLFLGIELKIKGDCAALFFAEDAGLQSWQIQTPTPQSAMVKVDVPNTYQTPPNVHRKNFYKGTIRRVIDDAHIIDPRYDLREPYAKSSLADILHQTLEKHFRWTIQDLL